MPALAKLLADTASLAARCVSAAQSEAVSLRDDELLEHQAQLSSSMRLLDITASALAAEIAHRSRRELGYGGLAQKCGARTPEALLQSITGSSAPAARRLVRVGELVAQIAAHDGDSTIEVEQPWLEAAVRAAADGVISGEALEIIRCGLGTPRESGPELAGSELAGSELANGELAGGVVTADQLATAVVTLTAMATRMTLDRLAASARECRDQLDVSGVAVREQQRRGRRYLRLFPQNDGMTKIVGLLDPESAAIVTAAIDVATSPRRGGPRFVDPDEVARAEQILKDPRTTEQLALDAMVELVDVAVRSRGKGGLGSRRADVRVLVTQHDLAVNTGVGFIEGQTATISTASVKRLACDGGLQPIVFDDDGRGLNLGRSQRLHSARQRSVISARDGGCIASDCDRPPSWSEVHHITEFAQGGKTDLADGVCLCRYHHMLVHNKGWKIIRRGARYWLIPPPDIDLRRRPRELESASPALRRLLVTV